MDWPGGPAAQPSDQCWLALMRFSTSAKASLVASTSMVSPGSSTVPPVGMIMSSCRAMSTTRKCCGSPSSTMALPARFELAPTCVPQLVGVPTVGFPQWGRCAPASALSTFSRGQPRNSGPCASLSQHDEETRGKMVDWGMFAQQREVPSPPAPRRAGPPGDEVFSLASAREDQRQKNAFAGR